MQVSVFGADAFADDMERATRGSDANSGSAPGGIRLSRSRFGELIAQSRVAPCPARAIRVAGGASGFVSGPRASNAQAFNDLARRAGFDGQAGDPLLTGRIDRYSGQ